MSTNKNLGPAGKSLVPIAIIIIIGLVFGGGLFFVLSGNINSAEKANVSDTETTISETNATNSVSLDLELPTDSSTPTFGSNPDGNTPAPSATNDGQAAKLSIDDAIALIPSQYNVEYHPPYNIEDDDGIVLSYGFYFYNEDTYGELWVDATTGELTVESRNMPEQLAEQSPRQGTEKDRMRIEREINEFMNSSRDSDFSPRTDFYYYANLSLLYFEAAEMGFDYYYDAGVANAQTALYRAIIWKSVWSPDYPYDEQEVRKLLALIPAEARKKVEEEARKYGID